MKHLRKSLICLILLFLIGVMIPTKTEAATASTLRITGATYPTVLKQGQSFTVEGIVKCNYKINQVAVVIRSTDLSKLYYKVVVNSPSNPYTFGSVVDNAMKFDSLAIGTYRYMVYAKDASGTSKFILDKTFSVTATGQTAVTAPSTLRIVDPTYPTVLKQGQSFTASGIIKCNYKINEVAVVIRSTDLSKLYYKVVVNNPSNPYTLGTVVDSAMKFDALAIGTYRYMIYAKDASGTSKFILDKTFSVTATGQSTPSTLRVVSATYPTTLKVGQTFNLQGTIKCNYAIKQVSCVIRSSDLSQLFYKTIVNNPRNPYEIATTENNGLKFENLAVGNYRYMIYAKDASGTSKYILDQPFSVTTTGQPVNGGESTLRIVSPTYPTTLELGTGFSVAGTVKSNYSLKVLTFSIKSSDLKITYDTITVTSPKNPYVVGTVVDNALEFDKLLEGTYRYVIHGEDASGTSKDLLDQTFTVKETASKLAISNPHYPVSVVHGTDFTLEGTITSNYNVVSLAFTIINTSTNVTVRQKNIFQTAKSYTIGTEVNTAMNIAGLPVGSYKYVAAARDESGTRLTLINRNFTVVEDQNSQYAIWPLSQVYITQGAYDSYSHQTENAFDCVVTPITGAQAFAPFDGRVVAAEATWGTIWFQSDNKVQYADGTYDYMTVIFMHGKNATSLLGKSFRQGEAFYVLGGTGPSGPNTYDTHLHVEVYKGRVSTAGTIISSSTAWSYRGNVYPNRALNVQSSKTTVINAYGYTFKRIS